MAKKKSDVRLVKSSRAIPLESGDKANRSVIKATIIGGTEINKQISNEIADNDLSVSHGDGRILEPPFPTLQLAMMPENSSELVQCIEAMEINIEGFGQRIVPRKMTEDQERVNNAAIETEREQLQSLLDVATVDDDMTALRRKTRKDLEVTGFTFWELLVSEFDPTNLVGLNHVEGYKMKLTRQDDEFTPVEKKYVTKDFKVKAKTFLKRFRRYVQERGTKRIYFKEWDDPRRIDKRNGLVVPKGKKIKKHFLATPLVYFSIYSSRTPYGLPRTIGNLFSIWGSRMADLINFNTFKNNNVPSMVVAVSNGMLTPPSIDRIEEFVNTSIKRSDNMSKFLILEAETADENVTNPGTMKIDITPLQDTQRDDQLFQEYDKNNSEKIRRAFRLPPIFVGKADDINRACYSEDTETLTDSGWKNYWEIQPEDKIATYEKSSGRLEYHSPIGKMHLYDYEGEMIHFKNRNADILVTPEHTMLAAPKNSRQFTISKAEEITDIAQRLLFKCSPRHYQPTETPPQFITIEEDIVNCGPRAGTRPPIDIPIDLWVELTCCFAADGTTSPSLKPCFIRLSANKERKIKQFREIYRKLNDLGFSVHNEWISKGEMVNFSMTDRVLWQKLRDVCGTHTSNKKIPEEFLHYPNELREIALRSLQNTDGTTPNREGRTAWSYSSISKYLADQVQILAFHSGHKVNQLIYDKKRGNRQISYRNVITPDRKEHQIAEHQIEAVSYSGKVYCFEVPNHFFITRRNGRIAIQGNTAEASRRLADEQIFSPEREAMDRIVNQILLQFGFRYLQIKTNSPNTTDDEILVKMLAGSEKTGGMSPDVSREILSDVFNRELPPVKKVEGFDPELPFSLTMANAVKKKDGLAPNQGQVHTNPPADDNKKDDEDETKSLDLTDIDKIIDHLHNIGTEFDDTIGIEIFGKDDDSEDDENK